MVANPAADVPDKATKAVRVMTAVAMLTGQASSSLRDVVPS